MSGQHLVCFECRDKLCRELRTWTERTISNGFQCCHCGVKRVSPLQRWFRVTTRQPIFAWAHCKCEP